MDYVVIKALRKFYAKIFIGQLPSYDRGITDFDNASELIYDLIASDRPCMIARFGSTELTAMVNYLGVSAEKHSVWKYIKGEQPQWWWNELSVSQLQTNAGVFPITNDLAARFAQRMLEDMNQVDILGSWLRQEQMMIDRYGLNVQKVTLLALEPYWAEMPWSRILKGKKVLVVHPFAPLIEMQYKENRERLFPGRNVLPDFGLQTIQAVQSIGGDCEHKDWFEALDYMEAQMDAIDYDIALIGCGGYGFPLAAHAKRMGKQAVHLGGALQLLFGIRGKRWDDPNYGIQEFGVQNKYKTLFNDAWVYPTDKLKPKSADKVEGGCYW